MRDHLRDIVRKVLMAYQKNDRRAFDAAAEKIAAGKARDFKGVSKTIHRLLGAWEGGKMAQPKAREALDRILQSLGLEAAALWPSLLTKDPEQIEQILLSQSGTKKVTLDWLAAQITQDLAQRDVFAMGEQMAKWEFRPGVEKIKLRAVVTKKKAHAVAGFNMGVCTASDKKLWDSKKSFYMVLFDEKGVAQGGVRFLVFQDRGKKYLSLAGINPGMDLLEKAEPKEVFDQIIALSQEVAERMGLEGEILIPHNPKDPFLASNRIPVQKVIQAGQYEKRRLLSTIQLGYQQPHVFKFRQVLVVPPRGAVEGVKPAPMEPQKGRNLIESAA